MHSFRRHAGAPRRQRAEAGRRLRESVPRSSLGDWRPPDGRQDVADQIRQSHTGRSQRLVGVRVARMAMSPYGFLRGAAGVMAADLAALPATGIQPVICGDAHLGNFGLYASPERELVIDLNDFDEAHPGGWEWDLRRLAVSVWVAGRESGASEEQCAAAVGSTVRGYVDHLRWLAGEPILARSYERLTVDRLHSAATSQNLRREIQRAGKLARTRTSDRALPRLTREHADGRRIVEEPPLLTRLPEAEAAGLIDALDGYLTTLPTHWARVLSGYAVVDVAHKVVGVSSVGLRAYVVLCEGGSPDDVLFLQLKEARRSVLARHVHGDSAWHTHQGQRVVEYQQELQTVSDPLLGWTTIGARQYYVRQFRDMKAGLSIDALSGGGLIDYAGICGRLLAKGHARTCDAAVVAGYAGSSDKLDNAIARFARDYADQTERDHELLLAAVRRGRLVAELE